MTAREEKTNAIMQDIAKEISQKLPEGMGFALLAYEFGEVDNKKMLYVSNSNREDVLKAMLEFVNKNLNNPEMFGKDV